MSFFHHDDSLHQAGDRILTSTWEHFPTLARNQLALTWVVYDDPVIVNTGGAIAASDFWQQSVRGFSYRGVECLDPAELVHLVYLVAMHEWLERGMVAASAELERAMQDMISLGNRDAAGLVVDWLTGTTSGPELPPQPFQTWQQQRNLINRYLQSLQWSELQTVNANQKTWAGLPYGRERQCLGPMLENRNQLTTDAIARLLHSIIGGVAVTAERSQAMMASLDLRAQQSRLRQAPLSSLPTVGMTAALATALPEGCQCWAMTGENSDGCYGTCYVEIPNAQPFSLTLFVQSHSEGHSMMTFMLQQVVKAIAALKNGQS